MRGPQNFLNTLSDCEVTRRHENHNALTLALEESCFSKGRYLINTRVSAGVGQKYQAVLDFGSHTIGHNLSIH